MHTGTTLACLSTTTGDSWSGAILEAREAAGLASVVHTVSGFASGCLKVRQSRKTSD